MPQIKSQFTHEEKKAFEERHNLWVSNHESLIEVLMQLKENNKQQDELLSHYISRVIQLEERIMEVAEHTRLPDYMDKDWQQWMGWRLIDKWK